MNLLLRLWGIVLMFAGGSIAYALIDLLFIHDGFRLLSIYMKILSLVGILAGVTIAYTGFKALTMRKQ